MGLELEARIQAADQSGLEVGAVDDLLEVLLAGDDQPDLSLTLVPDHFGQAVELPNALVRVADEGSHFVDHEDQMLDLAVGRRLRIDPGDKLVGNAFRCNLFVAEHVVERVLGRFAIAVLGWIHLWENLGESTPNG